MTSDAFTIPATAWQRRYDARLAQPGKSNRNLGLKNLVGMLPMIARMSRHARQAVQSGFDPINVMNVPQPGPEMGVPLGGMGGGSITRGWRGGFRRWQMRPGFIQLGQVFADQFSLWAEREGHPAQSLVLAAERPAPGLLRNWAWGMDPGCAVYQALFPRAWTSYDQPLAGLRLTCRQLSPVIAHNYRESSFPTCEFRWMVENIAETPVNVALMFTFQNGSGTSNDLAGGHCNQSFIYENEQVVGVELCHIHRQGQAYPFGQAPTQKHIFEDPLSFAIAAHGGEGVEVTYRARFTANGDGVSIWNDFVSDGRLDNMDDERPAQAGEAIGAGVCIRLAIPAGESREVAFALSWSMPLVHSGFGTPYYRRYTLFYGKQAAAARDLAMDTLLYSNEWEAQVTAWQKPILENAALPDWYRRTLFNELYYLVDGGTLWCYPADENPAENDIGHFVYLESHEYAFYNTYDVHFYASFALAMNWPEIELALQRDMGRATMLELPQLIQETYQGKWVPRKVRGAVPHDVGLPGEDPWQLVNGYDLHDVNEWKDLNPKLVLQVYRDWVLTGDDNFLCELWPVVEAALERVAKFDRDGDGLIENDGFPDQTYDVWSVKGPSAYTGGLWLTALSAAGVMAEKMGKSSEAGRYCATYEKGRTAYMQKLWNGRYLDYDGSRGRQHNSIMADQLAGQWYAIACGLPGLLAKEQACTALRTIFNYNVKGFGDGLMGAVNGMRPNRQVDKSTLQSQEVWSGTSYAVAAEMLQEGLREEAFQTAFGVYKVTYEDKGYWFQTPEAWVANGDFRSNSYMRPLSIWAMQWALDRKGL
jgi:non-lysosomal glucosylceramidase